MIFKDNWIVEGCAVIMSKDNLRLVLCLAVGLGLGSCSSANSAPSNDPATYNPPVPRDDGWPVAAAGTVGFDEAVLTKLTQDIRDGAYLNTHAVLVEKSGDLVYEAYFAGEDERWGNPLGRVAFDYQTLHDLRSVSKSVTSALLGIALAEEDFETALAAPVTVYFPDLEQRFGPDLDPELGRVTLQHVLTMTAGFEWNEMTVPYTTEATMRSGSTIPKIRSASCCLVRL